MAQGGKKKDYDLEHMPNFIKDAPWYMKDQKAQENDRENEQGEDDDDKIPFHQRIGSNKDQKQSFDNWYKRGVKP